MEREDTALRLATPFAAKRAVALCDQDRVGGGGDDPAASAAPIQHCLRPVAKPGNLRTHLVTLQATPASSSSYPSHIALPRGPES